MLSLITPAEGSVRQHPWLTYLLAGVLIAAFLVQRFEDAPARAKSAESLAAATEYFEANPTVALDPRFESVLGQQWVERRRKEQRNQDRSLLSGFRQRRTQEKFDEFEQQALLDREALPAARHGVAGADTPARNFLTHLFISDDLGYFAFAILLLICAGAAVECAWGPLLYSLLCMASVGSAAWVATSFHHELAPPWVGPSGLIAGLLMASTVASFRRPPSLFGVIPVPGWLLLPQWAGIEVLRLGGAPDLNSALLLAPGAAAGVGLASAVLVGLLKRAQAGDRQGEKTQATISALARARREVASGRAEEALELLSKEHERVPDDREVALALWETARECGSPGAGAGAVIGVIAACAKRGQTAEVKTLWLEASSALRDLEVDASLLVRIGQALLVEREPEEAVKALACAIDGPGPVSATLARHVIRLLADLDSQLTRRAALVALDDPALSDLDRSDLQILADAPVEGARSSAASAKAETAPAEHTSPELPPEDSGPAATSENESAQPVSDDPPPRNQLDRVEDLSKALIDDWAASEEDVTTQVSLSGGATSGSDSSAAVADSAATSAPDLGSLDPNALAPEALTEDLGGEGSPADTDEMARWNDPSLVDDIVEDLGDDLDDTLGMDGSSGGSDVAGAVASANRDAGRQLKVVPGILVALEARGLALEVTGTGKILLAWDRIDALSTATVSSAGDPPILVIDIVLNWMSLGEDPLRVIRLRSDRFDPGVIVPTVPALSSLLTTVLDASHATPLPDEASVRVSPFPEFASFSDYERESLMVESSSESTL